MKREQVLRGLAGLCTLFSLSLTLPSVVLYWQSGGTSLPPPDDVAMALLFPLVGGWVTWHRPASRLGWLCQLIGGAGALSVFSPAYAEYALLSRPGLLPGGAFFAWLKVWVWSVGWLGLVWMVLLFPNERLLSPPWRWVGIVQTIAVSLLIGIFGGATWPYRGRLLITNNPSPALERLYTTLAPILIGLFLLMVGMLLAAVIAALVRFRRAHGVERQQMKWFALAIVLAAVGAGGLAFFVDLAAVPAAWFPLFYSLEVAAFSSIPIAIGIAILRYRLWDIDVIIRRTLVYALLTSTLALVYWGGVVMLQQLFVGVQGTSPLVVVISTLAIAALFQPLRGRIQRIIDRRFYRRKYDAEQVLAAFSARVRNEMDLEQLSAAVLAVVQETMQPTKVVLWLAQPRPYLAKARSLSSEARK